MVWWSPFELHTRMAPKWSLDSRLSLGSLFRLIPALRELCATVFVFSTTLLGDLRMLSRTRRARPADSMLRRQANQGSYVRLRDGCVGWVAPIPEPVQSR